MPVVIQNPILNSPFAEPTRHFRFDENDQITDEIESGRRPCVYFHPVPAPRKKAKSQQLTFDSMLEPERKEESAFINRVRAAVKTWRDLGWPDVTGVTRTLLEYWTNSDRSRRLFFCQVEALETLVFITEVAKQTKYGETWIDEFLTQAAVAAGTDLFRMACKMATGSGKTVVMSMVVAWQTVNKRRNPKDNRFADAFLVVAPGITIRDRLRVLLPSDPGNYYQQLDIVPPEMRTDLGTAKIIVTNFHGFKPRAKGDAGAFTKQILGAKASGAFTESADEMVIRVCRELGTQREILVINDEAHHCYRSNPAKAATKPKMTAEESKEAKARDEEARLWLTGLEAVHRKVGVKAVFDLSATPFYLKGSGYSEGTLFPWVVSDFSLIDAIESGIVKIPRVPVADNAMVGPDGYPMYRNLWAHIRDGLPKKGRSAEDAPVHNPPGPLEGAMDSLYRHYRTQFEAWDRDEEAKANGRTPPVFIVVCNNTSVSKLVYDYIAGRETEHLHPDSSPVVAPGKLDLFSNVHNQRWTARPNTILVDSEQLESDDGMSADFKKLAAHLIGDFHAEYRRRFPGRDASDLTDEHLMREVLNTVGKKGKLGEHVRCVVSVSMLTEGWDANTVTHILGVRAFGTQLLCEQVVGRGLRRASYALNDQGMFDPEYADVYGVPFSFIPVAGMPEERAPATPRPGSQVRAVPERLIDRPWLEVTFPRVSGYRYDVPPDRLSAKFGKEHRVVLTTQDIPTRTENAPLIGETAIHTIDLRGVRIQSVAFKLATHLQQHHFKDRPWLFPQLLVIVKDWLGDPDAGESNVELGDETYLGLLLYVQKANEAAEKIARAILTSSGGPERLRAELPPTDAIGTTAAVAYDTTKSVWKTNPERCHLNLVPEDSGWETIVCEKLDRMDEVLAYVKNQNIGFRIPYTFEGRPGNYYPDLIVKLDDGRGPADPLNLILEVSGEKKKEKAAKVETTKAYWVPAVNNLGTLGRWGFLEIDGTTLHKTMGEIKRFLKESKEET